MDPREIQNKQFTVTRLSAGYDQSEVDSFLDAVHAAWTGDRDALDRARYDLEHLRAAPTQQVPVINEFQQSAESAARLLEVAQRAADQQVAEAEKRAQDILADTEAERQNILTRAAEEAKRIVAEGTERKHAELGRLEEQRNQLQVYVDNLETARNDIIRILDETAKVVTRNA